MVTFFWDFVSGVCHLAWEHSQIKYVAIPRISELAGVICEHSESKQLLVGTIQNQLDSLIHS